MTASQTNDLCDRAAHELSDLFRSRQASPVEATKAALDRIARCDGALNAFCLVAEDEALAGARASEARWHKQEPLSPLDGVPAGIKDLLLTRGWPTLRGSRTIAADQPWTVDAPVTARLREAGVVFLGKTTTPEFGCKGETNSPRTGITRNPWNLGRTSGGSSGGTAAAVAAGMGPFAIGTDGAGSIRIPAAFCGNFGLKPSFGRVPAFPLSPFGSVAHVGPHTMSVRDAALVMTEITRPDVRDWTSLPPEQRDYTKGLEAGIAGLRIAWSPTLGYARNVDPAVAAACARAVERLQELGAHVDTVDPGFSDPLDITIGLWFLGSWTVWNSLTADQQALTDPDFAAQAMLGSALTTVDIQTLIARRGALGSHMREFMTRYDLLVTPAVAIPAFAARPPATVPMTAETMLGWTPFSYPFNLTQQPACSFPCGLTGDGLPIGLQIVGPMFGDALVLQAAYALEQVMPISRPDVSRLALSPRQP